MARAWASSRLLSYNNDSIKETSVINWLVYNKNDIVVADVESEEEAVEVVQGLTEDPWWKHEAPYRIEMLP
jgi:hypothetical protein